MSLTDLCQGTTAKSLAVLLSLCLLVLAYAQEAPPASRSATPATQQPLRDAEQGRADGHQTGKAAGSSALWPVLGFFLLCIGVGLALLVVPSPAAGPLLGKSPEYVLAYARAYKSARRTAQFWWSMAGCGTALLFLGALALAFSLESDPCGLQENCSERCVNPCLDATIGRYCIDPCLEPYGCTAPAGLRVQALPATLSVLEHSDLNR